MGRLCPYDLEPGSPGLCPVDLLQPGAHGPWTITSGTGSPSRIIPRNERRLFPGSMRSVFNPLPGIHKGLQPGCGIIISSVFRVISTLPGHDRPFPGGASWPGDGHRQSRGLPHHIRSVGIGRIGGVAVPGRDVVILSLHGKD